MVQLASVGGIWLISYLVWWTNFAFAEALERGVKRSSIGFAGVSVILAHVATRDAWLPANGPVKRYAAVQVGDFDERKLRALHRQASLEGASLVVWPESAGLSMTVGADTTPMRRLSAEAGSAPFVTSYNDDHTPKPHNTASLFVRGEESDRYHKRRLFGGENDSHTPGERAVVASGVGLNICFDSCFPNIIGDTVRKGARVLALPTIDPPSTNHFLSAVHAAYTPFRAAESGAPMIRADGHAFSMVVDARGKIEGETDPGDTLLLTAAREQTRDTVYRRFGDWFLVASLAILMAGITFAIRKSRREAPIAVE